MTTLFSYCIPVDDGAAPNPFGGVCTLAVCKPVIRRVAKLGDWIVGTGSKNSPQGDRAGHVVYAMEVTHPPKSFAEYDEYCKASLPWKIPNSTSEPHRRWLGDAIYDCSTEPPTQRQGVHGPQNITTDLGGLRVLLSEHFYYFGRASVPLPSRLRPIVKQGQGHRSGSNDQYVNEFVTWIESLGYEPNTVVGEPQIVGLEAEEHGCARIRCKQAQEDEQLGDTDSG